MKQSKTIRTSLIAFSLASILGVTSAQAQNNNEKGSIDNTSDPNKVETIGNATTPQTLKGHIKTTGSNSKTTVTFNGTSKMEGNATIKAQITAQAAGGGGGGANTGAQNIIKFNDKSSFKLGKESITAQIQPQQPQQNKNANEPDPDKEYSILADGVNAKNEISDLTDGSTQNTISGAIIAKNSGQNTIFNLKNTNIDGAIIASEATSKNTITLDNKTNFKSYILANKGGVNDITLNNGAKIDSSEDNKAEPTQKATIVAWGENSQNIIKGNTKEKNNVAFKILANDKGKNEITLDNLSVKSDIAAKSGGSNKLTLKTGELTNLTTEGKDSKNEILLTESATIKGYIQNNETTNETEGLNKIQLEGGSKLDLHNSPKDAKNKGGGTGNDGAAIFTSKKATNEISGNSKAEHKITGNIVAKSEGENKITLEALTMTGDITTEGGKNTIKLGNFISDKKSSLTGNIKATKQGANAQAAAPAPAAPPAAPAAPVQKDRKDGINELDFIHFTMTGVVQAENGGENNIRFKDTVINGHIEAKQNGKNILELGNDGSTAKILKQKDPKPADANTGKILASTGGENTLDFNNGEVEGGIEANGGTNVITLGNATYRGVTKANIESTQNGRNTITIQNSSHTGSITANGGVNTITDAAPSDLASNIEGGIFAKESGVNSLTLKNIRISNGIEAKGDKAGNIITIGDKVGGVVTTNTVADNQGFNSIMFKSNATLVGEIKSANSGQTLIRDDDSNTQTTITGKVFAENGGTNVATLKNATITGGFHAKGANARNVLNVKSANTNDKVSAALHAEAGGRNSAVIGSNKTAQPAGTDAGQFEGRILAEGGGSTNELLLNHASKLLNSRIYAKAQEKQDDQAQAQAGQPNAENAGQGGMGQNANNAQTQNRIWIRDTSSIALFGGRNDDGLVEYAIYAHGTGAKNTINDQSDAQDIIQGDIVADNIGDGNAQNAKPPVVPPVAPAPGAAQANPDHATNSLVFKTLRHEGDITSYNGGENSLQLSLQNQTSGNILAQTAGKNIITLKAQAQANPPNPPAQNQNNGTTYLVNGQFSAVQAGTNTINLEEKAKITIEARGNDNAFRAENRDSKNSLKETNNNSDTTADITGNLLAEEYGTNEITIRNLNLKGFVEAKGGTNTISFGGSQNPPQMPAPDPLPIQKITGRIIASTANATDSKESTNTITANGYGSIAGSVEASGTSTEKKSANKITLKDTSKIELKGRDDIVNENGLKLGHDHEGDTQNQLIAVISHSNQAYNKITDESDGSTKSTISGNIYAEDNAQDANKEAGNDIQLKNVGIDGNIIAYTNGNNKLTLGQDKAAGGGAQAGGQAGAGGAAGVQNGTINGNITAYNMGKNTLDLTNISYNDGADKVNGRQRVVIRAIGLNNSNTETSNTLTLKKGSKIVAGSLLAKQDVEEPNNVTIGETKNTITLQDTSTLDLFADKTVIVAEGHKAKNIIDDKTQVKQKISGNTVSRKGGENTITLNHGEIKGDLISGGTNSKNTITIGKELAQAQPPKNPPNQDTDSTISGAILAEDSGSNVIKTKTTTYTNTTTRAELKGKNELELTDSSFKSQGIFAINGGNNTITFKNKYDFIVTGENNIAINNDNGNVNIKDEDNGAVYKEQNNNINGQILATKKGKTVIELKRGIITGDITARDKDSKNTLKLGKSGETTTLTSNILADDGQNELELKHASITGNIQATGGDTSSNTLTLENSVLTNGFLIARKSNKAAEDADAGGGGGAAPAVAAKGFKNTITLTNGNPANVPQNNQNNTPPNAPSITLQAHEDNAILADGNDANNTINDNSTGSGLSQITGNINARNNATNSITLKNVNMTGSVLATAGATNTLNYGQNTANANVGQAGANMAGTTNRNVLNGDAIANNATNTINLQHYTMTGSLIAITDNSKNTLDLKDSELKDAHLVAISDKIEAKNEIKIDDKTVFSLKGKQVTNAQGANVGSGNDAIYTEGDKSKNLITDNGGNNSTHTITGNITAHAGGQNSYDFKHINITGNIRATKENAANAIVINNASSIKNSTILAEGSDVKNEVTLKNTSKLEDGILRAISNSKPQANRNLQPADPADPNGANAGANGGGQVAGGATITRAQDAVAQPQAQQQQQVQAQGQGGGVAAGPTPAPIMPTGAKNTLKIADEGSKFTLTTKNADNVVVLARGLEAQNNISGENKGEGSITGFIIAENAGSNDIKEVKKLTVESYIEAKGNKAKNNIVIGKETGNSFKANKTKTGSATTILASAGKNTIQITNNSHTIDGDISSLNNGQNEITFTNEPANNNPQGKLDITGNLISRSSGSKNTIKLGGTSKVEAKYFEATSGINSLVLNEQTPPANAATAGGHFELKNGAQGYALLAQNAGQNILESYSNTESKIENNIIARSGGQNTLEKIEKLSIKTAYLEATGAKSKNSIVLKKDSSLSLQSSSRGDAIYADGISENKITDNSTSTTTKNEIAGTVNAQNGGKNNLDLINVKVLGDLIAHASGKNTLNIGGDGAAAQQQPQPPQPPQPAGKGDGINLGYVGALKATGGDASNVLTLKKDAEAIIQKNAKDNFAILASGLNSKNEIKNSDSGKTLKISGDIMAQDDGSNVITHKEATIEGDIIARSGGQNNLTLEKLSIDKIQHIKATGENSLNVLNYNGASFGNGVISADDFGENRVFVNYEQPKTQKQPNDPNSFDFNILTTNNGKNTLVAQNVSSVNAQILYSSGSSMAVFAQSKSATSNQGGGISASSYNDGVMLTLNAQRANEILDDFRDISPYASNLTRFYMHDKTNYALGGIYVGDINFLKPSSNPPQDKQVKLELKPDSALIASIYQNDNANLDLTLKERSKWIVTPTEASGVTIAKLSATNAKRDEKAQTRGHYSTLANDNTTVDLATGGVHVKHGVFKPQFYTLTINKAESLDHTTFKIFANTRLKQADLIKIQASENNGKETKAAILEAYHDPDTLTRDQVGRYRYVDDGGRLNTNNTLVSTIANGAKDKFSYDISKPTTVKQGFLKVSTEFIKKTESVNATGGTQANTSNTVDNYYIKGYKVSLDEDDVLESFNAFSVNYMVFLSTLGDLNKRLGEVRDEGKNHGIWTRAYGGAIEQNYGIEYRNNYINHQVGYDFGIQGEASTQYIGFSFTHGYNFIKSDRPTMPSFFGVYLGGGLYYSYVGDEGFFTDTVVKYGNIRTSAKNSNYTGALVSNTFSLSQEVGYRQYFTDDKSFFIEASAQGMAGSLGDTQARQSFDQSRRDATLDIKSSNSFTYRAAGGGLLGYKLKTAASETDFRAGATYVMDQNLSKINLSVKDIADANKNYDQTHAILLNFGVNSKITETLRVYSDLDIGLINNESTKKLFSFGAGVRYAFGAQKRDIAFGAGKEAAKKEEDKKEKPKEELSEQPQVEYKTIKISAKSTKTNGSEPESGFYLKLFDLGAQNAALDRYLAQLGFRINRQGNQVSYYMGRFDDETKAKDRQELASRIIQSLTKNPNAKADIIKIENAQN
ncbi:MAG: hypothetical protein E7K04_02775 [Helicobacter sp.]|nr:hypothetical protein [Helicobacter sp.]